MKAQRSRFIVFAACLTAGLLLYSSAQAVVVKRINLATMADTAGTIFSGTCTGKETVIDEKTKKSACVFTFSADRVLKGLPQKELKVRLNKTLVDLKQVPVFTVGEEAVLFLYKESESGFTSPVGLGQGRFRITKQADGTKAVVNDNNNKGLFSKMDTKEFSARFSKSSSAAALKQKSGPLGYDTFLAIIEELVK